MDNIYESVQASLYQYCKVFGQDMVTATVLSVAPTQYNFEAFAEQNDLPAGDIIGLRDYSIKLNAELVTINTMFGLSTQDDANLFRLNKLTGLLLKRLLPGARLPVYDTDSPSTVAAWMEVANGTDVSPVFRAIQRPVKFIAVTLKLALALKRP